MNKKLDFIILVLFIIGITCSNMGCSKDSANDEENKSSIDGIVAKVEDNQILVVNGLSVKEVKSLSEQEVLKKAKGAAYFEMKTDIKNLKVGYKVKVWVEDLDTSNPAHGTSSKIEILD
ncbi:DUF3221 domain-containing protein [Rummeliibacillus sp. SL167]|uniref:DUF3221 domain-containing protein n=1 Tax=Rummeliibacillus sp. SL167 TaxID=2579792 RepID=UPI0011B456BD|nr:DUF3221 domain-containing protein [Rummeliibacillus sp. SL167]